VAENKEMIDMIDWETLIPLNRCAGGHDDHMQKLFKDSEVIAHWNEGCYEGYVATCVKLSDGRFAVYSDSYGSCSGCDSWEDANDEEIVRMCKDLAESAMGFKTMDEVKIYLSNPELDSNISGGASELLKIIEQKG
jgi:hypothetical protein